MKSNDNYIESASRDLQELGFTDYETRVYISLLQESPATAYEIAKKNTLPRANVYTALENLERKNAVQCISHDPARFVPIDPTAMLDRISRTVTARCSNLQERLEKLKVAEPIHYVWNINNHTEARVKISELIAGAQKHIWIKAHHTELESYRDSLIKAADRGVSIMLILFGETEEIARYQFSKNCHAYAHEGDGRVVGFGRYLITLTVDFDQALIFNMNDESGAYTQSAPIVNIADSLIRHEIYLAEIFSRFGDELDKHFGPALLSLRKKYLPTNQVKELEARLKSKR